MADSKPVRTTGTLGPAGAFVVRFREGSGTTGTAAGRVEHVQSGREARFASMDELVAFFLDALGTSVEPPKRLS